MRMFTSPRQLVRSLSSAHAISVLALFVALGGGAYAAIMIGPDNIERDAVRSRHIKNGTITPHDLNRDLRHAIAVHGATGARGPAGVQGPPGAPGSPGPFADALPAGKTLRGTFSLSGTAAAAGDTAEIAETFAFALTGTPVVHVIPVGGTPPPECPGSATAPAAAAGHLCVFEVERSAAVGPIAVFDPSVTRVDGVGKASKFGFGVRVAANAAGQLRSAGTWAVTA